MDAIARTQTCSYTQKQLNATALAYYCQKMLPLQNVTARGYYRDACYRYRTLQHMDTTAEGRYYYTTLQYTTPRPTSTDVWSFSLFYQFFVFSITARRSFNECNVISFTSS